MHRNNIPIYIEQDATLRSLFYLETALHVLGWYHHPSSGAQTTVSTASGICHTVIAICRYRGRVGTGLSVLCVAYATHSTHLQPFHQGTERWPMPRILKVKHPHFVYQTAKVYFEILDYNFTDILNIPTNDLEMLAVKFSRRCG